MCLQDLIEGKLPPLSPDIADTIEYKDVVAIMDSCIQLDPKRRPTAKQLLFKFTDLS